MSNPKLLQAELNRIALRYKKQQSIFNRFSEDVIAFFTRNKLIDDLTLTSHIDLGYFVVSFINRQLQFRFEFDDMGSSLICIYDITDPKEIKKKLTCNFDGQGKVPYKDDDADDIYITNGNGCALFVHLLHEAVRPSTA